MGVDRGTIARAMAGARGRSDGSHPRARLRSRRRQADHARAAAAGRLIRRLHRRQPLAGLGSRADRAERPCRRSASMMRRTIDPGNGTGPFHGTVENIGASVDPNTRAVVARIVAPNPGDLLKKQMYVDVSIESGRVSTGLLVPVSAVLRDDENLPFVYLRSARRQLRPAARHARLSRQPELRRDERACERRQGRRRTARSSSSSCRANERRAGRRRRGPAPTSSTGSSPSASSSGSSSLS